MQQVVNSVLGQPCDDQMVVLIENILLVEMQNDHDHLILIEHLHMHLLGGQKMDFPRA